MLKYFVLSLLLLVCQTLYVIEAQSDQPTGFISIDCGLQSSNYTDPISSIYYISDVGFVDSGVSQRVGTGYETDVSQQFKTLRYFPEGSRNCYTFRPVQQKGGKYLIRARFYYGNYDGLNQPPNFDIHIGNTYWETVNTTELRRKEIIHSPLSDHIHICLIKTGTGIPFISTLELRPLDPKMYQIKEKNVSLSYMFRINVNPTEPDLIIRFPEDIYDRIWLNSTRLDTTTLTTTSVVDNENGFLRLPSSVMSTAAVPTTPTDSLKFSWNSDVTSKYYIYLHFAELEVLDSDQIRLIDIFVNGRYMTENYIPPYLSSDTVSSPDPFTGNTTYVIKIAPNPGTTLPPILNAAEIYSLVELPLQETFDGDVAAMVNIKFTYNLTENWQGDPCGPKAFQWNGISCTNNDGFNKPKIISLNLSSKRLIGSIAPAIFQLKALRTLDLSNNLLSGALPDFLAQLDSLTVLNLKGNNFSGSCPQQLIDNANTGKLNLISDSLCASGIEQKKKKSSILVPIVVAAGGILLVIICALLLAFYIIKRRKRREKLAKGYTEAGIRLGIDENNNNIIPNCGISHGTTTTMASSSSENENPEFVVGDKSRRFTYHEVLQMTHNFQTVIGKGGFGTVYHGYVGNTQVAVKMLSASSTQGTKEFQAEASLLLTIHHKNLTSLVGYCYEGTNMAIIYDYMPNGNMEKHILGNGTYILTWEDRLRMAIDAAQGLEYLHHGCKPPIVHRDIKLTNILVDEKFRAKLADFGLSRAFAIEDATQISTVVAGTPGYLDPEYFSTTKLTEKSDIYSFGIVLLEVVTGRPALPRNNEMPHIITWVSSEIEKGDLDKVVDPKLRGDYAINSIWKVLEVAMSCVARNSTRRPTMNFVVMELNSGLAMEMSRNETESKDSSGLISLNTGSRFNPQAR